MTRSFAAGAGLGQVELLQLPGLEGQAEELRQLVVLQFPLQFEQLCQLFQQLLAQMLFLGVAVDRRATTAGTRVLYSLSNLTATWGFFCSPGAMNVIPMLGKLNSDLFRILGRQLVHGEK